MKIRPDLVARNKIGCTHLWKSVERAVSLFSMKECTSSTLAALIHHDVATSRALSVRVRTRNPELECHYPSMSICLIVLSPCAICWKQQMFRCRFGPAVWNLWMQLNRIISSVYYSGLRLVVNHYIRSSNPTAALHSSLVRFLSRCSGEN